MNKCAVNCERRPIVAELTSLIVFIVAAFDFWHNFHFSEGLERFLRAYMQRAYHPIALDSHLNFARYGFNVFALAVPIFFVRMHISFLTFDSSRSTCRDWLNFLPRPLRLAEFSLRALMVSLVAIAVAWPLEGIVHKLPLTRFLASSFGIYEWHPHFDAPNGDLLGVVMPLTAPHSTALPSVALIFHLFFGMVLWALLVALPIHDPGRAAFGANLRVAMNECFRAFGRRLLKLWAFLLTPIVGLLFCCVALSLFNDLEKLVSEGAQWYLFGGLAWGVLSLELVHLVVLLILVIKNRRDLRDETLLAMFGRKCIHYATKTP